MNSRQDAVIGAIPRHVAIIMDGNNRWAKIRSLKGAAGHKAGVEQIRTVLRACEEHGVEVLTLFAFSSENWQRPPKEVDALMRLFKSYLKNEVQEINEKGVRLRVIGSRERFSDELLTLIEHAETATAHNTARTLVIAADYGGRWDIAQAARQLAHKVKIGELELESIDEEQMTNYLCLSDLPAPDLCIRTGGDHRISNFLLWQFAYSELYFTEQFWPDFSKQDFEAALIDFSGRQRRFGKTSEQVAS
ncbi:MAG: polyprenyl diphosphate synthase [Pseudomonadales bacterium]